MYPQCYKGHRRGCISVNKPFTFAAMSRPAILLHLFAILCVVALGAGLDVMEVDAAQYAGMSRDLSRSDEWLQLKYRGEDYLDKPPLLFWTSALSFRLFGVHDWSYRLPSILFAFLGVFATYRFTRLYHAREVAYSAMFVFGCSVAFFLMCNDVRCDTMLTGAVITAIWFGCAWLEQSRWWQLIGMAMAVAAAMLAKGPIGAVVPLFAIGGQAFFSGRWRKLVDPRLLVALGVVLLALTPMCIGLYQQHGLHGLRFYFWEQSFGRITGENRWKDDSTVLFFTHELLWQTLPWTILLLIGLWKSIKATATRMPVPEQASVVGAALSFIALSLSQFKLPHYLYVTLPLFAVVAARELHAPQPRVVHRVHAAMLVLLWAALILLVWTVFPEHRWPYAAVVVGFGSVVVAVHRRHRGNEHLFGTAFWTMSAIGLVLNGHFYPHVLKYQANAKAGQWAAAQGKTIDTFYGMQVSGGALDYYAGFPVRWLSDAGEAEQVIAPGVCIYTDAPHRTALYEAGLRPRQEVFLWNHPAQRLSLPFLDPGRRPSTLEQRYILVY